MSTYLLVCVIGKFEYVEVPPQRAGGVKVRGYCPVGYGQSIKHFVQLGAESLDYYENFFGIPFPLPKMDIVSLHSMHVRAMENWGCITFLGSVFLKDERNTSKLLIQRNSRTVAHEFSHMWFGNHVTMEWWDDIWLNEGFARFSEHHILNTIRPHFRPWDKYLYQIFKRAMEGDWKFKTTHPVQVEVPDPNRLMDIFDMISYEKGSLVCRMIHNYVGAETFSTSLKRYFTRFGNKNAKTDDLLAIMDEEFAKVDQTSRFLAESEKLSVS